MFNNFSSFFKRREENKVTTDSRGAFLSFSFSLLAFTFWASEALHPHQHSVHLVSFEQHFLTFT